MPTPSTSSSGARHRERQRPPRMSSTKWLPVDEHRQRGHARVEDGEHTHPAARRDLPDRHRAPGAQAMCSEGIAANWLACEASAPVCQEPNACVEATTSVKPSEHPRRRDRKAARRRRSDHVDEHERVAQRPVDVRPLPPEPAEQAERDDEVGVVVVVGEDQPERVVPGQPAVERSARDRCAASARCQHAARVAKRDRQPQRREVGDRVIHPASQTIASGSTHQRVRGGAWTGTGRAPAGVSAAGVLAGSIETALDKRTILPREPEAPIVLQAPAQGATG